MSERALATAAVHAGATATIHQASHFRLPSAEEGAAIHEGDAPGYFYGRISTPTQTALEECVAELEGGPAALATASGMSAIAVALLAVLEPGDRLVAQSSLYTSTNALLDELLTPLGIEIDRFDGADLDDLGRALARGARAVYLETPTNPSLGLVDIERAAEIAHAAGALAIVDSTFATPVNQRPLALGADVVVHSATKYLGGHGDLVAGVLVGPSAMVERARWRWLRILGPAISPHTAWLVLRGVRTLVLRMERHNTNALRVARHLESHPRVERVHYPGLESHLQHELARRQMAGGGGVVAFDVGTAERARRVVDAVELITPAVSLGDVASLIQHPASMTQASLSAARQRAAGVRPGLLRLSVGIESVEDVLSDLERALASADG